MWRVEKQADGIVRFFARHIKRPTTPGEHRARRCDGPAAWLAGANLVGLPTTTWPMAGSTAIPPPATVRTRRAGDALRHPGRKTAPRG